jgi:hypothetical protein
MQNASLKEVGIISPFVEEGQYDKTFLFITNGELI